MKTELDIARELKRVREQLAQWRANGWDDDLLYGAQQALIWMLGRGTPPSELEAVIMALAKELDEA